MKTIKARKMWATPKVSCSGGPVISEVKREDDEPIYVLRISDPSKLVEQCAKAANRACPKDTEELAIAVLRCIGLPIK